MQSERLIITKILFVFAAANDNTCLPKSLIRDGWWLTQNFTATSARLPFATHGARRD
jgi:hypothetical protein